MDLEICWVSVVPFTVTSTGPGDGKGTAGKGFHYGEAAAEKGTDFWVRWIWLDRFGVRWNLVLILTTSSCMILHKIPYFSTSLSSLKRKKRGCGH